MTKIISRIIISKTAEGWNIEFVYSVINKEGEYIQRNLVKNFVAVNEGLKNFITGIHDFLMSKIPDIEQ